MLIALAALAMTATPSRGAGLQADKVKARALAAEIAALDGRIAAAVDEYSAAKNSLAAVRGQIVQNRRLQRESYDDLRVARATLATRAVSLYKHEDLTMMDAVFGAADFDALVSQITMVRSISRCDGDVVRAVEKTQREVMDRASTLAADEKTAEKLVAASRSALASIRGQLQQRQSMLAGVRAEIRQLAMHASVKTPQPATTTPAPSGQSDGSGPWWSLIQAAASANGVDARGMYKLMMIESGGSATVVGPGGYTGLFQYAPSTWAGSWNPYRSSSITDGAAQIRATAFALRHGYGHAWWDPSYSMAFGGG